MTAKVTKASFPGHVIERPPEWQSPYVFASPHSGREYPARFLNDSILDLRDLRKSEDAYVDLLMPSAEASGVPILRARFPRGFVDVNRSAREIDEFMFTASPVQGSELRTSRVLAGFGAIPRYAAESRAIYAKKLSPTEGRLRMKWCYEPYHNALRDLMEDCRLRFGRAVLIDWHSMPSTSAGVGRSLSDIVLGDRYGVSAESDTVGAWESAFLEEGFSVSRNIPYAGGQVTTLFGEPARQSEAVQIEINRRLYLDENTVTRLPGKFENLAERFSNVVMRVMGASDSCAIAAE